MQRTDWEIMHFDKLIVLKIKCAPKRLVKISTVTGARINVVLFTHLLTKTHHFSFNFSKKILGRGSLSPSPDPSPDFARAYALGLGLRPRFSGASRPWSSNWALPLFRNFRCLCSIVIYVSHEIFFQPPLGNQLPPMHNFQAMGLGNPMAWQTFLSECFCHRRSHQPFSAAYLGQLIEMQHKLSWDAGSA